MAPHLDSYPLRIAWALALLAVAAIPAYGSASHPYILEWGADEGLRAPLGMASGPDGIYVADSGNARILKFNFTGGLLSEWSNPDLVLPAGVSVGVNGTVYVTDSEGGAVHSFDSSGKYLSKWGNLAGPLGIDAGPGGIYVVDSGNSRIINFNDTGHVQYEFGADILKAPRGISVDSQGRIIISDIDGIILFDKSGAYKNTFDSSAGGRPVVAHGLQWDSEGNFYAADSDNSRIIRMDESGTALSIWGSPGYERGQFRSPEDLVFGPAGHLYIIDFASGRIQKFATPINHIPVLAESAVPAAEPEAPSALQPVPGDLTKPTITPPADVNIEATGALTRVFIGQATAYDESGIASLEHNAPEKFTPGNSTVIWTAIDGAGNLAVSMQIVTVTDSIPPVISGLENIVIEATDPVHNIITLRTPNVTDAVGLASIYGDAPGSYPIGITTVTWTAVDVSGNEAKAVQTIEVLDTTEPDIRAPSDLILEAVPDGNTVDLGEPAISDNGQIASITNDAPQLFGLGNTTVKWLASDESGNGAIAMQLVQIIDTTPPLIEAPPDITLEASSLVHNMADIGTASVTDVQDYTIKNNAPSAFAFGTTYVTWSTTDASGNTAEARQIITVVDTAPPEVAAPPDVTAEAAGPHGAALDIGRPEATDATGIASAVNDAPEVFQIGQSIVTWTVTDDHANLATVQQRITVTDTVPPTITAPPDVIIEAKGAQNTITLGTANADDIVGIASVSNDAPAFYPVGLTEVEWIATDAAGNSATDMQGVLVQDTIAPQLSAPPAVSVEAAGPDGAPANLGKAQASDDVGLDTISNDAPAIFAIGATNVTWSASDLYGNTAQAVQTVTVRDTVHPMIEAPSDVMAEAQDSSYTLLDPGMAHATDIVGIAHIRNDAPPSFPLGDTIITWTAADVTGNTASSTQIITVRDTIPPEFAAPSDIVLEADSASDNTVHLGAVDASDTVGITSITNDAPEKFSLGTTIITWKASDAAGNEITSVQNVTILDTAPPRIITKADVTAEAHSSAGSPVDLAPPFTEDITQTILENDAPDVFPLGQSIVTWTVRDESGNENSAIQLVTVRDTIPPEIMAPADVTAEAVSELENIVDLGSAEAHDDVGRTVITNDAPDAFPLGSTIVTWSATDGANSANATQTVTIIDTTPPQIAAPPDVNVEAAGPAGNIVILGQAQASDVAGAVTIHNVAPSSFSLGQTIITWTATDGAGNTASSEQTVTVTDTTPPELVIPADATFEMQSLLSTVTLGNASSVDLTDPDPITSNDAPDAFELGSSTVTWHSMDVHGNEVSHIQQVEVVACGRSVDYYNMITGTPGDDVLKGTPLPDLIFGLGGDDTIYGDKGNDCILGGEGDDIIFGDQGDDHIRGGEGGDIIRGGAGADHITGDQGSDIIDGGYGGDTCDRDGDLVTQCS